MEFDLEAEFLGDVFNFYSNWKFSHGKTLVNHIVTIGRNILA